MYVGAGFTSSMHISSNNTISNNSIAHRQHIDPYNRSLNQQEILDDLCSMEAPSRTSCSECFLAPFQLQNRSHARLTGGRAFATNDLFYAQVTIFSPSYTSSLLGPSESPPRSEAAPAQRAVVARAYRTMEAACRGEPAYPRYLPVLEPHTTPYRASLYARTAQAAEYTQTSHPPRDMYCWTTTAVKSKWFSIQSKFDFSIAIVTSIIRHDIVFNAIQYRSIVL